MASENRNNKPAFVYVSYIATTPEKLWRALLDSELTKQYWFHRNVSDWNVGSTWQHQDLDDATKVNIVGKVLEVVPPRRLVISWAFPTDAANDAKHSRVTFEIEPILDAVRLTVTHDNLEPGSDMLRAISGGWPKVLSSLKSYLETGRGMPVASRRGH